MVNYTFKKTDKIIPYIFKDLKIGDLFVKCANPSIVGIKISNCDNDGNVLTLDHGSLWAVSSLEPVLRFDGTIEFAENDFIGKR